MGRTPLSSNQGLTKGAWTAIEDSILSEYIKLHGQGNWRNIPNQTGLKRSGKSCRLRWLNYLRPDIKRGNISAEEDDLIIRLHKLLGNRWSLIVGRLPGRTDNEIKNYWNTTLSKKLKDVKQQHMQHMPIRPQNIVQSIQINKPNKFQSPAQLVQKKRPCRCIKDDGAAAQDMEPNLIPTNSINVGEDDDELACVPSGSISPVLSEDPISLDNFNWDFDFDEFFLSNL